WLRFKIPETLPRKSSPRCTPPPNPTTPSWTPQTSPPSTRSSWAGRCASSLASSVPFPCCVLGHHRRLLGLRSSRGQVRRRVCLHRWQRAGGAYAVALVTIQNAISTLTHHGVVFVPFGYAAAFPQSGNLTEVHGGSPWGPADRARARDRARRRAVPASNTRRGAGVAW
ncbi:hypothetical protein C8R45DRAFT_1047634, partial [Mycena sanguinolenta]